MDSRHLKVEVQNRGQRSRGPNWSKGWGWGPRLFTVLNSHGEVRKPVTKTAAAALFYFFQRQRRARALWCKEKHTPLTSF